MPFDKISGDAHKLAFTVFAAGDSKSTSLVRNSADVDKNSRSDFLCHLSPKKQMVHTASIFGQIAGAASPECFVHAQTSSESINRRLLFCSAIHFAEPRLKPPHGSAPKDRRDGPERAVGRLACRALSWKQERIADLFHGYLSSLPGKDRRVNNPSKRYSAVVASYHLARR